MRDNIEANYWQQKNDIPFDYAVDFTQNDKIFAFTNYRNFWEYQTESDCWIKKQNNLISSTHYANLVFYDQYIYLLSARYDNNIDKKDTDCWRYSIETDSWEYISTLPVFIWHGIAFTYNNKLYTGFDWYTDNQLPVYKLDLKSLDQ